MNTPTALLAALLTADTPRWLVLAGLGLLAAAYGACGLLTLIGRHRRSPRQLTSSIDSVDIENSAPQPLSADRSTRSDRIEARKGVPS